MPMSDLRIDKAATALVGLGIRRVFCLMKMILSLLKWKKPIQSLNFAPAKTPKEPELTEPEWYEIDDAEHITV